MNNVGEKINTNELLKGREFDIKDLLSFFSRHGFKFWSWGAKNFQNGYNKFLKMSVSGHNHTGHVYIALNGLDLFDIYLTSNRGTIKLVLNDIYIEDIFGILDEKIEKIPAYKI